MAGGQVVRKGRGQTVERLPSDFFKVDQGKIHIDYQGSIADFYSFCYNDCHKSLHFKASSMAVAKVHFCNQIKLEGFYEETNGTMSKAVSKELISGTSDGKLNPGSIATPRPARGDSASVL